VKIRKKEMIGEETIVVKETEAEYKNKSKKFKALGFTSFSYISGI